MTSPGLGAALLAIAVGTAVLTSACSTTWVVVPRPETGYSATDTLWGIRNGEDEVRVTFRFDTIMRVDTVALTDTIRVAGTDTVVRLRRVLQVDTVEVRVPVTDTVVRTDTVLLAMRTPVTQVDTVRITETITRVDTIRVPQTVVRVDTVEVAVTDTVVRTETIHVPGRRLLFLPPGHYPPDGQCRVWVHGLPPGRQADPAPCDALGQIPAGAFILFGGDAWDFDYDWLAEAEVHPNGVPPEIIALKRRG